MWFGTPAHLIVVQMPLFLGVLTARGLVLRAFVLRALGLAVLMAKLAGSL